MASDGIVIERSRHAQEFVIIGNAEARDTRLSFRARGLHHYLLSLPPGWRVTTAELGKANPEGRDAIRTALAELVALRYVTKNKRQDSHGHWSTTMTVHDRPQSGTADASGTGHESVQITEVAEVSEVREITEDGFPGFGNPGVGESGAIQKTVDEDVKDQKMAQERASRRAQSSGSRAPRTASEVISAVRHAIADVHGEDEAKELSDGEALGLWATYARPKGHVRDLTAYMAKILGDAPYKETFLANSEEVCTGCFHWDSNCQCFANSQQSAA